jgi:hypothetical protein
MAEEIDGEIDGEIEMALVFGGNSFEASVVGVLSYRLFRGQGLEESLADLGCASQPRFMSN